MRAYLLRSNPTTTTGTRDNDGGVSTQCTGTASTNKENGRYSGRTVLQHGDTVRLAHASSCRQRRCRDETKKPDWSARRWTGTVAIARRYVWHRRSKRSYGGQTREDDEINGASRRKKLVVTGGSGELARARCFP